MNRTFRNYDWYDNIIADVVFFKTETKMSATKQILNLIKDSYGRISYNDGIITYIKTDNPEYIIKGLNMEGILSGSGNNYTEAKRYRDLLEEEELIEYLIKRIRISLPCIRTLININNITYYHLIKEMSYKEMKEQNLYDKGIITFKIDKKIAYDYLIHAFKLDINADKLLENFNKLEDEIRYYYKLISKKMNEK